MSQYLSMPQVVKAIKNGSQSVADAFLAYYRTRDTPALQRLREQNATCEAAFRRNGNVGSADIFLHHLEWIDTVLSGRAEHHTEAA